MQEGRPFPSVVEIVGEIPRRSRNKDKALEDKRVDVLGWRDRDRAHDVPRADRTAWQRGHDIPTR